MRDRRRSEEIAQSMSTIGEVKAAEGRVKDILDALKVADAQDRNLQDRLGAELKSATDEYSKAVLELNLE